MSVARDEQVCAQADERRQYERFHVAFKGKLFVVGDESEIDCEAVDLSAGGAGVVCAQDVPAGTLLVAYIDGFGRYEAVCARSSGSVLGLRFLLGEAKRRRLIEKLNRYVNLGIRDVSQLRAFDRAKLTTGLTYTLSTGEHVKCEVSDVSLCGVSLKSSRRPPINEVIQVGLTWGRVVRHHDSGFAIEYTRAPHQNPDGEFLPTPRPMAV